jgi:hypothetical protein
MSCGNLPEPTPYARAAGDWPMDIAAIAAHFGRKVQTVQKWSSLGKLPPADGELAGQKWWWWSTIEHYEPRERGRPPAQAEVG